MTLAQLQCGDLVNIVFFKTFVTGHGGYLMTSQSPLSNRVCVCVCSTLKFYFYLTISLLEPLSSSGLLLTSILDMVSLVPTTELP